MSAAPVTGEVTVACCQVEIRIGDVDGNLGRAERAVRSAARRGARLVLLPELLASGYVFLDDVEARGLAEDCAAGPTARLLRRLATELGLVLVAGVCERDGTGRLRNSALVVDPTGIRGVFRKAHLWDAEGLVFTPGDEPPLLVDTGVGRLAVMICYDLEFPEYVRLAALAGAELVCVPTNWPRLGWPAGERPAEVTRAQAAASTNHVYVLTCDRAGTERGMEWVGGSAVIDPDGFPLARADPGPPDGAAAATTLLATVSPARARDKRTSARNDALADRRPRLYRGLDA